MAEISTIHDSRIRSGPGSTTNYGTGGLWAKSGTNANFYRKILLAFDLSSVSSDVDAASLRLTFVSSAAGRQYSYPAYGIDDSADEELWDESSVTWDNYSIHNTSNVKLAFTDSSISTLYEKKVGTSVAVGSETWDITDWVNLRRGDSFCTIVITNDKGSIATPASFYDTSIAPTASERPTIVTTGGTSSIIPLILDEI